MVQIFHYLLLKIFFSFNQSQISFLLLLVLLPLYSQLQCYIYFVQLIKIFIFPIYLIFIFVNEKPLLLNFVHLSIFDFISNGPCDLPFRLFSIRNQVISRGILFGTTKNSFREHTEPEIVKKPVDDLVLQMKAMKILKVDRFPFPRRVYNTVTTVLSNVRYHYWWNA